MYPPSILDGLDASIFRIAHRYRNDVYHAGRHNRALIGPLGQLYAEAIGRAFVRSQPDGMTMGGGIKERLTELDRFDWRDERRKDSFTPYETALRGVHHQELLRFLGLLPINRVAAAARGARTPRRKDGRRVAESVHVEDKLAMGRDGRAVSVSLYAQDGAIGIGRLTDRGQMVFEGLRRIRTHRTRDKSGAYRWYNDYRLPTRLAERTVTVRLHANDEDLTKRFNRTENVRPIPPSDPEFARIYARRNDAESINRNLEDTLFLGRAHSVGRLSQQVDLIGYALLVNGLTVLRHERRGRLPAAA